MPTATTQGQVDLAGLVRRIEREFPDLEFDRATLNDRGEDHAVVVLDECWVFRFPRNPDAKARGTRERRLLKSLNPAAKIATPKYEFISKSGDFGGYRLIPGRELGVKVFGALPRIEQEGVLEEIGVFLRLLHVQPQKLILGSRKAAWSTEANFVAQRHLSRRDTLGFTLGPTRLHAVDRFYAALAAFTSTNALAVIHGDFTDDHILLESVGGRLAGVIDFTDACFGDPAYDFAFLWAYGPWVPERVARAYGPGVDHAEMLVRSLWWFTRYRIDQVWWTSTKAREDNLAKLLQELDELFETLKV